jgi:alcohol dehydrogenase class IV
MAHTTYGYPATERVVSGPKSTAELGAECDRLGLGRVLLLSTPSLAGSAAEDSVRAALGDRCAGVSRRCAQHVPLDVVSELIDEGRGIAPDGVVTVGGGSVTDAGKALAAALAQGCSDGHALREHRIIFAYPDSISVRPIEGKPVPLLSVPTTLSAAEYDGIFGMTHAGTKDLYNDPRLAPRVVILDPEVTRETPAALWAGSGIRALDHGVEIYLSGAPTAMTDAAALHTIRLLFAHLPASLSDPSDDAARLGAMHASWLSMVGVENVTLGLSHGIGHQIGARCGVPHGVTSCVMLPTVMEHMVDVMPRRLADLAVAMDPRLGVMDEREAAARAPELVREFVAGLGLPTRLSDVGVDPSQYDLIAEDSMADFVVASAPLEVSKELVVTLLQRAA